MVEASRQNIQLADHEKVTSVMIYTENLFAWGDVVTTKAVRVSTWLRTPAIPQYIYLHNSQVVVTTSGAPKAQSFREIHIPSSKVIGFHIKPPEQDPLDYDPDEPMRKMEPTTALVGAFRFDGFLRMSTVTSLDRFLDVMKETYTSIYDVQISFPSFPSFRVIRTPIALLRNDMVLYSPRDLAS